MLEDAPAGVESGLNAGMRVVGILSSHTAVQLSRATVQIGTLAELPEALATLGFRF